MDCKINLDHHNVCTQYYTIGIIGIVDSVHLYSTQHATTQIIQFKTEMIID